MFNVTFKCVRVTIVVVVKAMSITCSECVSVALVMQHAKSIRCVILTSVVCLALPCDYLHIIS